MDATRRPARRIDGMVGAALALLAAAVAAVMGVTTAGRSAAEADRATRVHRWTEVVAVVHETGTTILDEVNALATMALARPEDPTPAVPRESAARAAAVTAAVAWLEQVLDDPLVGPTAQRLQVLLEDVPAGPGEPADADDARGVVEEAGLVLAAALAAEPELVPLAELVDHAHLPRLVLSDALDAAFVDAGAAAPWIGGYFDGAVDYITSGDGGWFGEAAPLPSPWLDHVALAASLPDTWVALQDVVESSSGIDVLSAVDAWVTTWPDRRGPSPHAVAEVAMAARDLAGDLDALVAATVDATGTAASERAGQAGARRSVLVLVAGPLALGLVALGLRLAVRHRGQVAGWRRAALVDQLTGIANRRGLEEHCATLPDADTGHALLLFDMDHFKAINDRYGHQVGDVALQVVAAAARATAGGHDGRALAARLGGDELVVVLHDLDDPGGVGGQAAQALIQRVRAAEVPTPDGPVTLSVSVGVATAVGPPDLADLLLKADMALYQVKRAGRGSHRTWDDQGPHAAAEVG